MYNRSPNPAVIIGAPGAVGMDYRRRARRLRATLRGRPGDLYRALRALADEHDGRLEAGCRNLPMSIDRSIARSFSGLVEDRLENGVLRFSARRQLIRQADAMGIGRFEANLLIALVQHRGGMPPPDSAAPGRNFPWILAVWALVQGAVVAGLLWLGWG